ncbi:putative minor tail protein [Glutamicibacter phage BIM BV-113]|nr:putative minor tail protein [Glutamicibacter phage BIM BV-113]
MIFYASRTLVISGRVIAKSHDYLHEAMRLLAGLSFRKYAVLAVEGHGPTQTASVRVNGRISFSQRSDKYLQYEIPLIASDPFKYGEARSFDVALGATGTVFQRGTVEAWPNMIVTGNMPSYTVRFRGVDVEVPIGISSGQTHRIEYRTRRLYENGSFVMGGFGSTNFRPVQAGIRSDLQLIAPSGSGQVKMTLNDTYL